MSVFREYDIRGLADEQLTDDFVAALGSALAEKAKKAGDRALYVGHDVRLSADRLCRALTRGIHALEMDTWLLPTGPTPLLYFSTHSATPSHSSKSGVMITGSHNPPEYNGFKTIIGGKTLFGEDIQQLRERVNFYLAHPPKPTVPGKSEFVDRSSDYISDLSGRIRKGGR